MSILNKSSGAAPTPSRLRDALREEKSRSASALATCRELEQKVTRRHVLHSVGSNTGMADMSLPTGVGARGTVAGIRSTGGHDAGEINFIDPVFEHRSSVQ